MLKLKLFIIIILSPLKCIAAHSETEKICLFKEDFSTIYSINVAAINETKLVFDKNKYLGNYCKVYLKFPVKDHFRNAGIYKNSLIFANCLYLIKAKLYIPQKTKFHESPRIIIFDENWKVISSNKKESYLPYDNNDSFKNLEFKFLIQGNGLQKFHIAIHGQFDKQNNENECEFYIKSFEMFQIDELIPDSIHNNVPASFFCFDQDFDSKDINNIATLNIIASNFFFYITNLNALSSISLNRYLHKLNPSMKILAYFNAEILPIESNLFKYVESNQGGWIIKDKKNNLVEERNYPGNVLMDVTNIDYLNWITDIISSKVTSCEFDGVFLDMVCAYYYPGYYTGEGLVSRVNGQINTDQWKDGFINFIRMLRGKGIKFLIGNGLGLFNGDQYFSSKKNSDLLINELDGFLIEEFAVKKKGVELFCKEGKSLLNDITMLNEHSRNGKFVLVSSNASKETNNYHDKEIQYFYVSKFFEGAIRNSYIRLNAASIKENRDMFLFGKFNKHINKILEVWE